MRPIKVLSFDAVCDNPPTIIDLYPEAVLLLPAKFPAYPPVVVLLTPHLTEEHAPAPSTITAPTP
jgi:hypothetical protein